MNNCYDFWEILAPQSSPRSELMTVIKAIKNDCPQASAARCFRVNRTTCINLLSLVATYMLIIVQFNKNRAIVSQ